MYPRRRYPTLVIASGTAFFPVSELQPWQVGGRVRYLVCDGTRMVDKWPANSPRRGWKRANNGYFQPRKPLRMVFTPARIVAVSFYCMKPMCI